MINTRTQLFYLSAHDWKNAHCSVCGAQRLLKYRDAASGWHLCDQCLILVVRAERFLIDHPEAGLRHPTPEECKSLTDH